MTVKIFKSVFITAFLVLVASVVAVFIFTRAEYSRSVYADLEAETEALLRVCPRAEDSAEIGRDTLEKLRVTFTDAEGQVLFDSTGAVGSLAELPEISGAIAGGASRASRYSTERGSYVAYYARPLPNGEIVRIAAPYRSGAAAMGDMIPLVLALFVGTLLLAFGVSSALSAAIVAPISRLDLDSPDGTSTFEELRPLMSKISSQNYKIAKQRAELVAKKNEFNSITANMSEGLVLINSRGAVVSCNNSARKIFGVGDELPSNVGALYHSESFAAAVSAALAGENGYEQIRTDDKFYSLIITPVLHNSDSDGAVIVAIDETEKEAREALRREFTSNISHELKTPLTSISGFSELIAEGVADGAEARAFAAKIRTEATRLITLVGDIIRLTQLDGGEIPYDGMIDVTGIAEEVASRLSNLAARASVTLSVRGEHVFVIGNSTILFEMIYNLVDNGIKYNRKGGRVELRTFTEGGCPVLSVKDNGIGIPHDKQDRVFERFYRVDKSHSKEIGGTGLGLSIVKHAAAYHKAKLELISDYGVGTEIVVRFASPAAPSQSPENNNT